MVVGALGVFYPLAPALMFGAWLAHLAAPLCARVKTKLGGKSRAAAAVATGMVLAVLLPVAGMVAIVVNLLGDLVRAIRSSGTGRAALQALLTPPAQSTAEGSREALKNIVPMIEKLGSSGFAIATQVLSAASAFALQAFVLVAALFTFLAHGSELRAWLVPRLPLPREALDRLHDAFNETGRGLIIGTGLTALAQALVATVLFAATGVPRAVALGGLTFLGAFVPVVGTALVWMPVAVSLAVQGRWGAAITVAVVGAVGIGGVDNVLRPALSRWAKLSMPAVVVLLAMLGGLSLFDGFGIFLGPLLVRLGMEALDIAREARTAASLVEGEIPLPSRTSE